MCTEGGSQSPLTTNSHQPHDIRQLNRRHSFDNSSLLPFLDFTAPNRACCIRARNQTLDSFDWNQPCSAKFTTIFPLAKIRRSFSCTSHNLMRRQPQTFPSRKRRCHPFNFSPLGEVEKASIQSSIRDLTVQISLVQDGDAKPSRNTDG